jgi:ABC-2 type transport system permease protein
MPLSMVGGAMVPTFVMPAWVQSVSFISPIRWTMLAIEGGVWRQFTIAEMATPCAVLIGVGAMCFAIGTRGLREA